MPYVPLISSSISSFFISNSCSLILKSKKQSDRNSLFCNSIDQLSMPIKKQYLPFLESLSNLHLFWSFTKIMIIHTWFIIFLVLSLSDPFWSFQILFGLLSSSFWYSQAVKVTWIEYKKETNNPLAIRNRFKDSVDFIGWYTNKTKSILKIPVNNAFKQYIAYHEGWGNYKYYKKNKKVIGLAKKVEKQSKIYRNQLKECKKSLDKKKYIIY